MPRQQDDDRPDAPLWRALDDLMHERRSNPTRLARESGVSHATIYGIRSGRTPYPDTLSRLARALAPAVDGTPDEAVAQANFATLMTAAGYAFVQTQDTPVAPSAAPPPGTG